ncbi:MAG: ATP-binding cassette domain-containing protein [Methanomicrobiales archaeon]|nr:ATP-binding cassette domain-containing protein [Methanomicrobiales archaeon]NYT20275.1 ATP-binding cassette domain-containing protein [Methanomicrobiales archaeon]
MHLVAGRVGSGKTTLALLSSRLIRPDTGTIGYDGIRAQTLSFQYPEYHITGSTLREEAESYGVDPTAACARAGIAGREDQDPFRLSRGELKMFQISCILMRTWDLLILDEPFSALDCRAKLAVCRAIDEIQSGIVLVITHEQHILPRTDYLWEMRSGVLTGLGTLPEALFAWESAPGPVRMLRDRGILPANLRRDDMLEAACRMHEYG